MVKIYAMTHKKCSMPEDPMYIPMQVGHAIHEDLGYACDDTGDHISQLNPYYSELTGMYWIWKNEKEADIVGLCHYRRFLLNEQDKLFTEKEIIELLAHYDLATTRLIKLNCSYYEGFAADHNQRDMDIVGDVIRTDWPEYYDAFDKTVHADRTYFGNMIICRKELFDRYSAWLFDILQKTQKRVDMTGYDGYQMRLYGFISEILLYVFIKVNRLKVKECRVAMLGEKKETIEIKEKLAGYFRQKNIPGAKSFFLECLKERPDVLMEASDVYGELKICMQLISTAEYEHDSNAAKEKDCREDSGAIYDGTYLDGCTDLYELIPRFQKLNEITERRLYGRETPQDLAFLKENTFSSSAMSIAETLMRAKIENKID